jgi:YD repeat-containing protein
VNGNTIRIPIQAAQFDPPLREGKFLSIFEVYDANARGYWREVWVYNRKISNLTTSGQFVTVTFEGEPIDFKTYSPTYFKYYVRPFQRRVYGGDIRVKSLTSFENGKSYKTKYVYADEDGFSTGVTPTLPAPYGEFANDSTKAYTKPNTDWYKIHHEDWRNYRTLFTDHAKSYGRPAPGVVYSRVEVMNVDENGQPLNGKTVYEFYTAKDDPYLPEDDGATLVLNNKSSLYGTPKAITYYEQTGSAPAFRKIKQNQFHYALSEDLIGPERVASNKPIKNSDKKPLGLLQEKFRFHNEFEHPFIEDLTKTVKRQVDNRHQSAYNLYAGSTTYDYSSAAATAPLQSMTVGKLNFKWEALSGQTIESGRVSSDRQLYLTAVTPAYWKYEGMEKKNMLTQTTQETTYLTALPPNFQFDPDLFPVRLGMMQSTQSSPAPAPTSQSKETKQPAAQPTEITSQAWIAKIAGQLTPAIKLPIFTATLFPQREVLFSKITTWSGSWHGSALAGFSDREQPWRQDDVFIYNKQLDLEDGVSHFASFDPWANTNIDKDYPAVTPAAPWQMIDNTTLYDIHSHLVEQKRLDGTRTTWLYGYGQALPIAMAKNATAGEVQHFNFEEGASPLITNDERKTGEKAMKAVEVFPPNTAGSMKFSLKENVSYRVSFWAKKGTAALTSQLNLSFAGQGLPNQTRVGGALQTNDRWEYLEGTITPTQAGQIIMNVSAGIAGSGQYHYIDDIRIHPIDAQMETYAYDPLTLQVSAITNENNLTTYYEYDAMGRLIHIRDQDRNLRKRYVYNYGTSKQSIVFPPPQLIATGKAGGN